MKKIKTIIIIITLLIASITISGCTNKEKKKVEENKDAIKFAKEYTEISKENVFVYRNAEEIIKIMEKGTGIVYLGFPECPWCQAYVKYLDEVAQEVGIDKIFYYNIAEDRKNNTENYKKMVAILKDNLQNDDEGNERIYAPNVSFHIKGEVIGNDYETSLDTKNLKDPKEYWTKEEIKDLKEKLTIYTKKVYEAKNTCTDCNK